MRSHLISQVVLRRFADSNNEIIVHNIKTNHTKPQSIYNTAYREVDSDLIHKLEQHWSNNAEDPAKRAINTLASSNVLLIEKHINVIKKLLSLHYIRSGIFLWIDDPNWANDYYPKNMNIIIAQYPDLKEKITAMWEETKLKAAIEAMTINITRTEEAMKKYGFEIGEAPEGSEFILGDLPTLITDGEGNYGPQNGVTFTNAHGFAMPLTPRYIVALKKDPLTKKYIKLTSRQVQNANNKILEQITAEYYTSATYRP